MQCLLENERSTTYRSEQLNWESHVRIMEKRIGILILYNRNRVHRYFSARCILYLCNASQNDETESSMKNRFFILKLQVKLT